MTSNPNSPEKLNIILFCNRPKTGVNANTVVDHIDAFSQYSSHNIYRFSNLGAYPTTLDLNRFDVVVVHYSSSLLSNTYISSIGKDKIREFPGLKILFVQDEYRQIHAIQKIIFDLGFHVLFTCFDDTEAEIVYPKLLFPNLIKINTLTGYVPEALLSLSPPAIVDRPIDVGYRGRKLPYWYGKLSVEKWTIQDDFLKHTAGSDLNCDVSSNENQRIYGDKWLTFVQSCKTMLGVESGASVLDFTGVLEKKVEAYQLKHPQASFAEVADKFLLPYDGKVKMNQISPRCFEAIALKTALVLFEGEYSGILKPGRHYIELKKDFSNISDVVSLIKDPAYLQKLTEVAYQEIALNPAYSYQTFIQKFDKIVTGMATVRQIKPLQPCYTSVEFAQAQLGDSLAYRIKKMFIRKCRDYFNHLPFDTRQKIKGIRNFILKRK